MQETHQDDRVSLQRQSEVLRSREKINDQCHRTLLCKVTRDYCVFITLHSQLFPCIALHSPWYIRLEPDVQYPISSIDSVLSSTVYELRLSESPSLISFMESPFIAPRPWLRPQSASPPP